MSLVTKQADPLEISNRQSGSHSSRRIFSRHLPLFDATMPRRHARPDARDGDATSVDIRTHHLALERRAFASACTLSRA